MSSASWVPAMIVIERVSPPLADISGIQRFAEKHFGLAPMSLSRKFRGGGEYTEAKHILRYYLRNRHPKLSLSEIGSLTCMADHSTVVASVRRGTQLYARDKDYRKKYDDFEKACIREGYHAL